jgi:hypothetical protein
MVETKQNNSVTAASPEIILQKKFVTFRSIIIAMSLAAK